MWKPPQDPVSEHWVLIDDPLRRSAEWNMKGMRFMRVQKDW